MPVITFDLGDLKAAGYEAERLVNMLPTMGIEVEGIEGTELTVSITPNRQDLLDYVGFVRALDNFTGKKVPREGQYAIKNKPTMTIEVTKAVQKIRPYIAGLVAKNVDLSGNKVKYMINFTNKFADTYGRRRKKIGMGVHDLRRISGQIVYDAAEDGKITPLESQKEMSFAEVVKKNAMGVEYGGMYAGKKVLYPFIKDSEKTLVLVPIVQCEQTKTTDVTKDIFVEITGTSKKAVEETANLVACSLIYSGADVYPVTIKYSDATDQTPKLEYREMKVNMRTADRTLGVETARHDVVKLANKTGYVAAKYGNNILFYVPPFRIDVLNEQDLIEDIAIAYGYDNIIPLPVTGSADGLADEVAELENKAAVTMVGAGYLEAMNSMLTNETVSFRSTKNDHEDYDYVKIADAKSENISMLRTDLIPELLQNLQGSAGERMPQRLFEIGRVFKIRDGKTVESIRLGIVTEHSRANFSEIKSVVAAYLRNMGVESFTLVDKKGFPFIDGRYARIKVGEEYIGVLGEIHPQVLANFGIEEPVAAAELYIVREVQYQV